MATLLIAVGAGVAFIIAYHTYGRWLGGKVFNLAAGVVCPSERLRDDMDYVPTAKPIVFGHHFTSIAGTGPIVGPAIAVMWGWLPALLWVVLGSIFIGAVHDFGALVVSLRNNGQTVGDIAGRVLNRRVRLLFLFVLFMALTIVLAIFGLVIAAVFQKYPAAIFPCLIQIPIAVIIGIVLHRKGINILLPSIIALAVMYLTVIYGNVGLLGEINAWLAGRSMMWWVIVLLVYSYVASVLPVWTLLQPRDYINSLQLLTALALIVVGLGVAAFAGGAPPVEGAESQPLAIVAPMIDFKPSEAPVIFPFLFITIACGAISGFHCLVSSGTSSKQIQKEPDARFVGFGGMLTEGFLATLVILACVAGIGMGIAPRKHALQPHHQPDYEAVFTFQGPDKLPRQVDVYDNGSFGIMYGDDEAIPKATEGRGTQPLPVESSPAVFSGHDGFWIGTDGSVEIVGAAAWNTRYQSWSAAGSLGAKVGAFVDGAANFLKAMGIPAGVAIALMGVLVASFAGTTLDTACRLQRYVVQELAGTFLPKRGPSDCPECGYDLTGNVSGKCPECGAEIDRPRAATVRERSKGVSGGEEQAAHLRSRLVSPMNPFAWLHNKHGATIFAIVIAVVFAALPAARTPHGFFDAISPGLPVGGNGQVLEGFVAGQMTMVNGLPGTWLWLKNYGGKGGLILWPMFGATNQLLGGLSFLVITFYLWRRSKPVFFLVLPLLFMLIMPAWAMLMSLPGWISPAKGEPNWALISIAIATLAFEAWMIVEAVMLMPKVKGVLEAPLAGAVDPAVARAGAETA